MDEYFKKYVLSGKGRDPEEMINEACKEVNYQNHCTHSCGRLYCQQGQEYPYSGKEVGPFL